MFKKDCRFYYYFHVKAILVAKYPSDRFYMWWEGFSPVLLPASYAFPGSPILSGSLGLKLEVLPAYHRDDRGPEAPHSWSETGMIRILSLFFSNVNKLLLACENI